MPWLILNHRLDTHYLEMYWKLARILCHIAQYDNMKVLVRDRLLYSIWFWSKYVLLLFMDYVSYFEILISQSILMMEIDIDRFVHPFLSHLTLSAGYYSRGDIAWAIITPVIVFEACRYMLSTILKIIDSSKCDLT